MYFLNCINYAFDAIQKFIHSFIQVHTGGGRRGWQTARLSTIRISQDPALTYGETQKQQIIFFRHGLQ